MGAIPSGADPSGYDATALEGTVVGAGLSVLATRTEANVRAAKKKQVRAEMKGLSDQVFDGIDPSKGLVHGALKAFADAMNPDGDHEAPDVPELLKRIMRVPILGDLVEVLTGIEDGDYHDLGTWGLALRSALQAAAEGFAGVLTHIPLLGDLIEILSGVEDGNPNDLGTFGLKVRGNIQEMVDNVVTGLFGWIGNLFNGDDAARALQDAASTIANLSAQVTALESNRNNQAVGGVGKTIDFTQLNSSTTFGAGWAHVRSGGNGHYEIVKGTGGKWIGANDSNAIDAFTYVDLATATDYQKIWIPFGSSPQWFNATNLAYNEIHGRKNAAGTRYVFAHLEKYKAQLGCQVDGARTIFVTTSDFSFKSTGVYALECGTVGGLRIFRLLEGNTVVLTHTEVGTTSYVGADYRYAGGIGFARATGLGSSNPGTMWAFAFGDNQPVEVIGSGAKIYAKASSSHGIASGTHEIGGTFWSDLGPHTGDITIDLTTGRMKVSEKGWYQVIVRLKTASSSFPNHLTPVVFRNGLVEEYFGDDQDTSPNGIFASTVVYLDIDDYVSVGYNASSSTGDFVGENSGAQCYFKLVRTGQNG